MSLLAIGWEPEIRGLLTVIIGVVILCGSVYGIMATNIGSRLAFLVAITGLAGWMMLMGAVWMIYGIGLRGPDPTWKPVAGAAVLQDVGALGSAGVLDPNADVPDGSTPAESSAIVSTAFLEQGWEVLDKSSPVFGQAQAAATEVLVAEGAFTAGQFEIIEVFDTGGERWPKLNDTFDFLAFRHTPHYVIAEAAAFVPVRTEPGRAPVRPVVDETRQREYVYMVRDLGARRQPPFVLMLGAGIIFFALCFLLNRRDRLQRDHLANPFPVAKVEATTDVVAPAREKVDSGV
jgi:hypothetical protein